MSTLEPGPFVIEIVSQGWLGEQTADFDPSRADLCSHGDIRLVIGGRAISAGDGSAEYTISTSALALLRTLDCDHSPYAPVADRLILHCGMLLMLSCPYGIDWTISHRDGRVSLADVVKDKSQTFPGLAVDLSETEYRRQIVAFAERAKEPFADVEKAIADEVDRADYEAFWHEYDELLNRGRRSLR